MAAAEPALCACAGEARACAALPDHRHGAVRRHCAARAPLPLAKEGPAHSRRYPQVEAPQVLRTLYTELQRK